VPGPDPAKATAPAASFVGLDEASVRVTVNGEPAIVPDGTTVADVVRSLSEGPAGLAVAVDREVVPRSSWDRVLLSEGSEVEVVTAAAGG
jgi:sulfur carrier protein